MAVSFCLLSRSLTERQTDMPILHVPLEENSLCARASTAATVNFRSAVRAGFELLMKVLRKADQYSYIQAGKLIPFPYLQYTYDTYKIAWTN